MLTVGSLFAGIGGFDLGLERAGMRVIWQSEIDPYASAVLRKHWPAVPNYGDIQEINTDEVERPEIICGGFPCQDTSNAGSRRGLVGAKSGLWTEMRRVVLELRPTWTIIENSAHGRRHWADVVRHDLEWAAYSTVAYDFAASDIGANHERRRCFVLANTCSRRLRMAHEAIRTGRPRAEFCTWWASEPAIPRVDDGLSRPMDRARRRVIGNAVVPQIAEIIGRAILKSDALPEGEQG